MSTSKGNVSGSRSGRQIKSIANNSSPAAAVSLPAVPAHTEQKEDSESQNQLAQLKTLHETDISPVPPSDPDKSNQSAQVRSLGLSAPLSAYQPVQRKNDTGMPDSLKSGIENVSGYDMSDVKVHYNSQKPAQLQALAYAQGTNIHVAPGQEKHLPHEAWHVVQQKQGRVQPTVQMKQGIPVNDNEGLERE